MVRRASRPDAAPPKAKTRKLRQPYRPYKVAKLKGPASRSEQKKREELGEDRISQLPEDILVAIISLLTLQEAGRTSVLSRKWRNLWTFTTGRLNFDAWKSLSDVVSGVGMDGSTYVSWVNKVLKFHQGPFIDEFKICFSLGARYSCDIDSWVDYAREKGVRRFELDLASSSGLCIGTCYDFPGMEKLFSSSNSVQHVHSNDHVTRTVGSAGFCSLTTLRLRYVNVTDEVLEHFLANCPFLEQLCVIHSERLVNLKVAGHSLKLKYLNISYCTGLRFLEICAMNLMSLTCKGTSISVIVKNAPVLSELSIGGGYCASVICNSCLHLSYLHQLESLKLELPHEVVKRPQKFLRKFPELYHLRQLELEVVAKLGESLIIYTSLIRACPLLSRFAMRYAIASPILPGEVILVPQNKIRAAKAAANCQHQCLKVVELAGCIGHADDLELASHLVEIAVALDKIIINPRSIYSIDNPGAFPDGRREHAARKRAMQLETKLPPNVNLVVL